MNHSNPVTLHTYTAEIVKSADDAPPARGDRKKLMKLEAIRGFAAIYVLCHHSFPEYTTILGKQVALFKCAQEAVMLFFILSGFVIQYAYLVSPDKSFKSFFLKRFLRIFIPLICVFIGHYILLEASGQTISDADVHSLTGNLLMLQQVPDIWNQPSWFKPFLGNKPLWTLTFEWWFYMMFFFISYRFGKSSSKAVYIISTLAAITYVFFPFSVNREIMYFILWWMGAEMAKLYVTGKAIDLSSMKIPLLVLAGIGLLTICHFFYYQKMHPENPIHFVTTPGIEVRHFVFCFVAVIAAIGWKRINWFGFAYTFGLFEFLAPISFSLYISHWYFVSHAHYMDDIISNIYLRFFAYLVLCCGFCYVVEKIIYPKLSMRILRYFSVKKKSFVIVK